MGLLGLFCPRTAVPAWQCRTPKKNSTSAANIIKDVEIFIKEHGRRPSRGVALGKIVHVKLKSTSTSAEEKKALQTAMASAPIGHAATTARLKTVKSKLLRGAAIADEDKKFCINQTYTKKKKTVKPDPASSAPRRMFKRPASSAPEPAHASLPFFRRGRPRLGEDLQNCQPTMVEGIPLLHQALVDWLHRALYDFQKLMEKMSTVWFVSWGTLLGLHRDGGFIPYDVDIDVILVVHDLEEFTWQVFPSLRSSLEAAGYRLHPLPSQNDAALLRGAKIAPAIARCESLHVEVRARVAEESCKNGLRFNRSAISKRTSDRLSGSKKNLDEERRRAIGLNTLDIELAVPSRIKKGHLDLVGHPGMHIKSPVVTERAVFGGVPVFKPKGAGDLLRAMYPDGISKRVYRFPANGKLRDVPASVPKHVAPSFQLGALAR